LSIDNIGDYQTWLEPPASFALQHQTFSDAANNYALRNSLWGATVDGCSSDNANSRDYMGDQTRQAIPLVVHGADETAAVRCCSHDGSSCESQVQGVCHDVATFHDANAICAQANMRLCSQAEMGSGVCCNSGCWFNHFASWISDGTPEYTEIAPSNGEAEYLGCFRDTGSRDMGTMRGGTNAATNSFATCRAECGSMRYMSLQFGGECFCANDYSTPPAEFPRLSDSECNGGPASTCQAASYSCGASWSQAIYEINPQLD
jgi:hypothetical protein